MGRTYTYNFKRLFKATTQTVSFRLVVLYAVVAITNSVKYYCIE